MKLLYPLSLAYELLSKADRSFTKQKTLDKPVISVGNLTWGGTGKTPIVIELLELITKQNLTPVVLTRGYGRKSKESLHLKSGAFDVNPSESGDEPLLIARSFPNADVIVGSGRYKNVLKFRNSINPGVFVLDDGFQHWKIKRDLDIVCVNAANPFGNGMVIPAGILREKPSALERAGLVVITNSDMISGEMLEDLNRRIMKYYAKETVITYYGDCKYKNIGLNEDFGVNKFLGKDVYSLSGIGFAKGFANSIEKSGVQVKGSFVLSDHESYDKKIITDILDKIGDAYLVTTAKDAVKIGYFADEKIKEKIAVLTVKTVFKKGKEQWEKTILKNLPHS
ncbi:MAG: tetraacyldisaccharide 4'-kinase [Endomicrobia bacterium]|nr:tetraacyldisaccharide 4'-kinase [Endomicrobiia bacterium]